MTKRPKLGAVFAAEPRVSSKSGVETTVTPSQSPTQGTPVVEKIVQLNVAVPESLRREVKIKALQRGQDMNTVVKDLLTAWLNDLGT